MKAAFRRFVEGVVRQTDCSREEREDLIEELLSHLEDGFRDYRSQGYSEEEAKRIVMTNFGSGPEVGKELQHAMYPYRREMLLGLSVVSLLFAYSVYLCQLLVMGDAHIPWLVVAVSSSTGVLFVTVRPIASLNRRLWMNGLLLIHLIVLFYGFLLATDLQSPYSTILTIVAALLLLFSIILIYRTTIYDYPSERQSLEKDAKRLHYINITTGIIVVLVTLFFLWAFLLFAEGFSPGFLLLLVPIGAWIVSYAVQMHLLAEKKKSGAYAIVFIQTAVLLGGLAFWLLGL
ncbi:permease prefix domain 1-containing protein [Sporosarcina sp. 179-K 3D1 HS]|uniref:permease prefix domain 1-containing protein n=1 Tax=Sporosarcina sp. 179-K 3D1 HS TaxID=3232169 RepID=UPI0039A2A86B